MQVPEPTELIHLPRPTWVPVLTAAGLAALIAGLFTWTPYAVVGAIVLLLATRKWMRSAISEVTRLPRRQRLSTSPIPLTGVARTKRDEGV